MTCVSSIIGLEACSQMVRSIEGLRLSSAGSSSACIHLQVVKSASFGETVEQETQVASRMSCRQEVANPFTWRLPIVTRSVT